MLELRLSGRKGARSEHRLGHESAVGNRYAVKPAGHAAAVGPARCPGSSAAVRHMAGEDAPIETRG